MDNLQRQLRNLAKPEPGAPATIARADAFDLIFQTAEPQKRWVRYCINPSDTGMATGRASLWFQASPNTTAPTSTACPQTTGWATTQSAAQGIVNTRDALNRALFEYNWSAAAAAAYNTSAITRIRTDGWVDVNPGRRPAETRLSSGVYLRNQNQAPTASFTFQSAGTGSNTYVFNASSSVDPEGRRLDYFWYRGTGTVSADCQTGPNPMGTGIVLSYKFAAGQLPTTVQLCVLDPSDLTNTISRQVPVT
jgi:hypothetical protein